MRSKDNPVLASLMTTFLEQNGHSNIICLQFFQVREYYVQDLAHIKYLPRKVFLSHTLLLASKE